MAKDGSGGPKDAELSKKLFETACTYGGPRFCNGGQGNETRTTDGGKEVNANECKGSDSSRCMVNKVMRYSPNISVEKLKASEDFFRQKCVDKDKNGCQKLGLILQDTDPKQARDLFDRSCFLGNQEGCVNLGYMYLSGDGLAEEQERARLLFLAACDADDGLGCVNFGIYVFTAVGAKKDDKLAQFEKGCKLGEATGCHNAGIMYNLGMGTTKDVARAKALLKEACDNGLPAACRAVQQ
jgi:hypothetical protein